MRAFFSVALFLGCVSFAQPPPAFTEKWTRGTLDIHQIATGRGNAALVVFPDATTMIVDAGPGGDAIASYVEKMAPAPPRIDYAVLTHFHADHVGGLADVAARLPIDTIVDRGYRYLPPPDDDPTFRSYRAFATAAARKGTRVEAIRVGRTDQIVLRREPAAFRSVEIRNVAANGEVWTGNGNDTTAIFPPLDSISALDRPSENMCSIGLRIRYGRFDFFTGGDMPGVPDAGAPGWQSVETAVARALGPTDAHVVNHHGSIDPESEVFLATLRSPVMIVPAWSATHPSQDVLKRMMASRLYPGPHDIFVTLLRDSTRESIGARAAAVKADHGHIVVRVAPGGDSYRVLVIDESSGALLSTHGPYTSF
jgi:beta-lactamase superfamily II metal-dependent hydrolase